MRGYTPPLTGWRRAGLDAVAMAVYVAIVYGTSLTIGPLGRDYALLAHPSDSVSRVAGWVLSSEVRLFGDAAWAYHCVNLGLLYACMLLLYRLTNRLVAGPWWFGTLAAVFFMANPVHSEAVLNLCGSVDLLPCLLALAAVTVYVESALAPRVWNIVLAPLLFGLAVLAASQNAMLLPALIFFDLLLSPRRERPLARLALPVAFSIVAWCLTPALFSMARLDPAGMFGPLYFIFYPLGFLPSTARALVEHPVLGWAAAAAALFILLLIYRKARRPVLLFGLLSATSIRLFQGDGFVDPVHMIGGGQLLLANAFFNIALVCLFHRIMDHRKWRRQIVTLTTLLCVAFFALEFRSVLAWRHASALTRGIIQLAACAESFGGSDGRPLAILTDFQYYAGAPMCVSASVAYETPFSEAMPVMSLIPLHYAPGINVDAYNLREKGGIVTITSESPVDLLCYPYVLSKPGGRQETDVAIIETIAISSRKLSLRIAYKGSEPLRAFLPEGFDNLP